MERINGETIAGIAFILLSVFLLCQKYEYDTYVIIPADFLIIGIGCVLIIFSVLTQQVNNMGPVPVFV